MKIKITVRNPQKAENTTYSFRFGETDSFVLLRSEVEDYLSDPRRQWNRPFTDLSRIMVVMPGMIDIIQTNRLYDEKGCMAGLDASGRTVFVDVRKLFRRTMELGAIVKPNRWDDVTFELDDARFQPPHEEVPRKTVMQLVNSFSPGWEREHFVKSLLSFRTLTRENWDRLMRTLSDYSRGKLRGGGKGEINFSFCGMYGGIICRDTDFSVHT